MATLLFKFVFVSNASPAVVLTSTELTGAAAPTVNISSTAYADSTVASVVSGGALVYDSYTKTWSYRLASADLATYCYVGMATTTYATASPASVHALGIIIPDELTSTRLATSGYTAPPSASTVASQVRTELTTELARLDAAISSRNATTPPTASAVASQVRTELTTELARLDAATSTRLSTTGYTTPPTAAAVADAVWDEVMGHTTASTAGALLATAGAADPLLNVVPGSYAAGTAGAALGAIGSGTAVVVAAISGTSLTITNAATFTATITGLTIGATWTALYWTVKTEKTDADSTARVQLRASNPTVGTDGLLYLNGAAATAAQGSLVVTQAAGTVALTLTDNATAQLAQAGGLYYDLKALYADGSSVVLTSGLCDVALTPTKTI